ncbi:1-(5-phosphoribosyl)-5-[(5-phosphoribosylamino)methylideneamino] imidazole-4-carboxamide isomerase [Ruegeria sp. 2012CJ41-6]|uniref:1-(5-phosphoribosyl)-5-[(5-phosphoribosylamino)methylideneamino] imidazole-4-carboxamide isomerase n=1 Tax=Ruegeria spongiae TaxID=2942209 RepID=A0ABT0PZY0_9RHOB|nr:1-(5-phosphoribosyl)-5-[(5-phosphoribosylamino)methylideneamino] imidazole-4-carboxamide isomerase [Ruegeria spongiae]MCL6283117.1 1-(5-phosphoribosyl)-5-[(5-phosphoribosylamino)methylideneamino] imidazole-4-carboxamide isomerase [Ruegeria spongiae]
MIIYPTMELQNGHCVTLTKGRLEDPMLWHVDPVETARGWAAAGAEYMQITDFDAIDGKDDNGELIEEIIRAAGIPVQLGGGMRSREAIERWIDKGAGRVVVGTLAAIEPDMVKEMAKRYPDQIVLSVDVWRGQVMTEGWRSTSAFTPESFIEAFDGVPLAAIIVTDIDSDMEDLEAQLGLISALASHSRTPVIASGVVRSSDDISRLAYIHNISGALVSRALFFKTLDLSDALAVARQANEPVAEFR